MTAMEVKDLTKVYRFYKRRPGLISSMKSLFHRHYEENQAVRGISFNVHEGELLGVIGPNGAGKTTTLKMLSGLLYPTSGMAKVLGYTPWERKKEFLKQIGFVMGQKGQLNWDLPPMESFILNKEIYEIEDNSFKVTVTELSQMLNVEHLLDVTVRKLSLGERMKCEIIAALLHSPRLVLLDEPTIGLDVVSQMEIRHFFKMYNHTKKRTIILTSHHMEDIKELCPRVIIIHHGQLVYDGALKDVVNQYVDDKLISLTFSEPIHQGELEKFGQIVEVDRFKAIIKVERSKVSGITSEILNTYNVLDLVVEEPRVEGVIANIFKSGLKNKDEVV